MVDGSAGMIPPLAAALAVFSGAAATRYRSSPYGVAACTSSSFSSSAASWLPASPPPLPSCTPSGIPPVVLVELLFLVAAAGRAVTTRTEAAAPILDGQSKRTCNGRGCRATQTEYIHAGTQGAMISKI
eukprot:COSAG05_NODE_1043_length_6061_cov_10.071285_3_plen_129_part_00